MNSLDEILEKLEKIEAFLRVKAKPFLCMDEAASYLGIPKNTLYSYTSKGVLPFHKVRGRRIFFSLEDLNRFVLNEENRVKDQEEIESLAESLMDNSGTPTDDLR